MCESACYGGECGRRLVRHFKPNRNESRLPLGFDRLKDLMHDFRTHRPLITTTYMSTGRLLDLPKSTYWARCTSKRRVRTKQSKGRRKINFTDFHRLGAMV